MSEKCYCGGEAMDCPCVCDHVVSGGYTRRELHEAFEKVSNKDDWKDRIYAVVPVEDVAVVAQAIIFFTATKPKFKGLGLGCDSLEVTADGYRIGPAGDH